MPLACANCNALLVGPYCHQCGQRARTPLRNAFRLFGEWVAELFEFDSRVRRTFVPLFVKPGHVSTEWVRGRRASYVSPVRLYLFVSIVFFIVFAWVSDFDTSAIRAGMLQGADAGEQAEPGAPAARRPSDRIPVGLPFLDADDEEAFRRRYDAIADNPSLFFDQARALLPHMMFLLLPVFALLLKVLYLFARRFYAEHLVFALHTHAFVFMSFLLMFALNGVRSWATGQGSAAWIGIPAGWGFAVLWLWIPVYLFLAQKRFYGQGWFFTTVKFGLAGFAYFMMLLFALLLLVVVSVVTT